jgi:hypothetical protein
MFFPKLSKYLFSKFVAQELLLTYYKRASNSLSKEYSLFKNFVIKLMQ